MVRRHSPRARIVTRFTRIPEEIPDGKVRCAGCGKVVSLTPNGHTRRHNTPKGDPCAVRATYAKPIHLDEIPEVQLPPAPRYDAPTEPRARASRKNEASRLDVGSKCEDCGRWLPGERYVCGKCSNARNAARRKRKGA